LLEALQLQCNLGTEQVLILIYLKSETNEAEKKFLKELKKPDLN